jgi:hypothetical protein
MNVNLHIERLVLDGVEIQAGEQHVLVAVLESELSRLLSTGGLSKELTAGGPTPSIKTNGFDLSNGMNPRGLGREIAQSVYSGLKR